MRKEEGVWGMWPGGSVGWAVTMLLNLCCGIHGIGSLDRVILKIEMQ